MKKGFTLVELLIVLAVIAALMAVATPMALNAVKTARASQVAQNLRNIMTAIENYVNVEQELPTSTNTFIDTLVSKGYLSSNPTNYSITYSDTWTTNNGRIKATIIYGGGDVAVEDVQKQNPNVTSSGNRPAMEVSVVKWW
ncbi:MAG TPA: type II secretion system protein [Fervidobacterium sp.]|nr:type II secretion system protein [Fervidobacterium sp.]